MRTRTRTVDEVMIVAKKETQILLVEDNPADVDLTREVLIQNNSRLRLNTVPDGEQAMSFLHRRGRFSDVPRPDIIILDLNLPGIEGREVLREIMFHQDFRKIPVIVFSSSRAPDDVLSSYRLGANCYIQKPVDFDQFRETVKNVGFYWLLINQAPVTATITRSAAHS